MSNQNKVFSFFTSLKNKINSFISNALYSSEQYNEKIYNITNNKNNSSQIENKIYLFPKGFNNHLISHKKYEKNIPTNKSSLNNNETISKSITLIEDNYSNVNKYGLKEADENISINDPKNKSSNLNTNHKRKSEQKNKNIS